MIFLEIYFCVFTMFLNNVSTSTVKDKTRSAQNLAVHILACGCLLTSPGLRVPELCTDHASLGVLCELAGWGQAGPRPAPPLPLFHPQRGSVWTRGGQAFESQSLIQQISGEHLPVPGTGLDCVVAHLVNRRPRLSPWEGKVPWRRAWQLTPLFLPGEPHGPRSLAGCTALGTVEATGHKHTWRMRWAR